MKTLVYGAGVLGSLIAARLCEAGEQVTLLARGPRLAELREQGVVLESVLTGIRTTTRVPVVDRLAPEDEYDWVLVVMRKSQVSEALPALAANRATPNILFLMNNAAGPHAFRARLGPDRALFGFAGAGGVREGGVVRYVAGMPPRKARITLGELSGVLSPRLLQIASALEHAGFRAVFSSDIDAWLKTHVALIYPLAGALYMAGGDNYRLARTPDAVVQGVRGMQEALRVLTALGIPVEPVSLRLFALLPEPLLVAYFRRLLNSRVAEYAMAGHARAARDELGVIAGEFRALVRAAGLPTPVLDELDRYFDPATALVPEGNADLPLDYRRVWIALGVAGMLVLGPVLWKRLSGAKR